MLFATSVNEHVGWMIIWTGAGLWVLWHILKKTDTKGEVKERARAKILSMLFKWLEVNHYGGGPAPPLFQERIMKVFIVFLMGLVIGIGLTLLGIFMRYKVEDREWWEEYEREVTGLRSGLNKMVAENAELRVALAAAERTEDAKKVAAMTLAALGTTITTATEAM